MSKYRLPKPSRAVVRSDFGFDRFRNLRDLLFARSARIHCDYHATHTGRADQLAGNLVIGACDVRPGTLLGL